jgi:hypothetical protein
MTELTELADEIQGFAQWWRENKQNSDTIYTIIRMTGERSISATKLDRAAEAIRALSNEHEWEYAVRDAKGCIWFKATAGARPGDVKIRRRKAGEWEQVEEE